MEKCSDEDMSVEEFFKRMKSLGGEAGEEKRKFTEADRDRLSGYNPFRSATENRGCGRQEYAEKLLDGRWINIRQRILERDGGRCRVCNDGNSELHVHHRKYTGEPWNAPLNDLITLCATCHSKAHVKPGVEARK